MTPNTLNEVVGALIGNDTKLGELNAKGLGPDSGLVAGWAIAWSHYALAGDALVTAALDGNGFADIKGVKIGPQNTVAELMAALGK